MREVTITIERYDELLKCEARVETAISLITSDKYMSIENMLLILGAKEEASKLKENTEEMGDCTDENND